MKKLYISLFIIFGISFLFLPELFAQSDNFSILSKSGDVQIKKKSSKSWQQLKPSDKLAEADQIRLFRGSYLGLVHKNGRTLEITSPGTYTVSQLSKKISEKKSNATKRFTQYVKDEIESSSNTLNGSDYRQNMQTVGATERAMEGDIDYADRIGGVTGYDESTSKGISAVAQFMMNNSQTRVNACFPGSTYLVDDVVDFSWSAVNEAPFYNFFIVDRIDSVIIQRKVYDTAYSLNIASTPIKKGKNYYWFVTAGERKSDEYCIHWMDDFEAKPVLDTISMINEEFNNSNGPLHRITLATFYEDANIMNRAVDSYIGALSATPGNNDYTNLCCRYLRRVGQGRMADHIEVIRNK